MKLVFMGTPEFSVPILEALIAAGHEILAVYCQPPRPAGRGKENKPGPVQIRAEELGLPVRHPKSLRDDASQVEFASLKADAAIVVAYGLILPKEVLEAPRLGCLNIHASLLPRWRGAAPIHRAIMAGDEKTGICIMQMDEGLDTGPVLLRKKTLIGAGETTQELHDRLSGIGATLVVKALDELETLQAVAQPEDGVTYAQKIDKSEARIDWSRPAIEIDRLIRGLAPFPGAWCEIEGERVKLLRSQVTDQKGQAGEVLEGFTIACGTGAIKVLKAQRQGKRPMSGEELLHSLKLPKRLA